MSALTIFHKYWRDTKTQVPPREQFMPRIQIITNDTERVLELSHDFYICGRSDDCDLVIDDPYTSRHHFTLFQTHRCPYFRVADGNIETGVLSRNGVRVNGSLIAPSSSIPLNNGDEIHISPTVRITYLSPTEDSSEEDTITHDYTQN